MNSFIRPRRLRRTGAIREMVGENIVLPKDFIYPLFIHDNDQREEIDAMPGSYRWDLNGLIKEVFRVFLHILLYPFHHQYIAWHSL